MAVGEAEPLRALLTIGTPLWAAVLLPFLAAYLTHRYARTREREKDAKEELRIWRKDAEAKLEEIVALARTHYYDPLSLPSTELSAFQIGAKLKSFSAIMRRTECIDSEDMTSALTLPIELREIISDPADFGDPSRVVRQFSDDLNARLLDCQERLVASIGAPRRRAKKR